MTGPSERCRCVFRLASEKLAVADGFVDPRLPARVATAGVIGQVVQRVPLPEIAIHKARVKGLPDVVVQHVAKGAFFNAEAEGVNCTSTCAPSSGMRRSSSGSMPTL